MGSGRRSVIWVLGSLLLLLEASSARSIWRRELHERPAEKFYEERPWRVREPSCPPAPLWTPAGACEAARCQAHAECPRPQRCCYNGCAYTCLEAMPPPPIVDWLVEPQRLWRADDGWLVDGPEEELQAEICSTTDDGVEEPLLCPTGYECHILTPGDTEKGIPNFGECIKQSPPAEEPLIRDTEYPEGNTKNVAEHGRGQ